MRETSAVPDSGPFRGVVAIDGPAGSGKSTVARDLALELGARYLDTGAMYRAVTWAVLHGGTSPDDASAVTEVAGRIRLTVSTDARSPRVSVDDRPVDSEIRSPAVTRAVSAISAIPAVRNLLVQHQRRLIGSGGIVVEGRDIGAVVAPQADVKVFLTASSIVRADRRSTQQGTSGPEQAAATAADLSRRDQLDSTRALAPLEPAADAVILDSSELSVPEVVAVLRRLVAEAVRPRAPGAV